jgi:hypothetical protein
LLARYALRSACVFRFGGCSPFDGARVCAAEQTIREHLFIVNLRPEAHCLSWRMNEEYNMLYTIAVVLIVLWLLGLVTSYTMGGFVHVLLVIAVVMILVNIISGRRIL